MNINIFYTMYYLKDIGTETKENEYKQPVSHTLLTEECAIKTIEEKKPLSNTIFFKEIKKDMDKYFPKYLCSFLNAGIDGKLFYGVNDCGDVIGFPWKGELKYHNRPMRKLIKNQIKKILYSDKIVSNVDKKYIFDDCFKISIKVLDKKKSLSVLDKQPDVAMELYNKWLVEKKKYDNAYSKYKKIHHRYSSCVNIFTQKLEILLTDKLTQKYLLIYIFKRTTQLEYNILKKKIINRDYPHLKSRDIFEYKKDRTSPYYWVTRFKDFYVDNYCKIFKPKKPHLIFKSLNPSMIVSLLQPMYYRWMQHRDMNLYVILLEFSNPLNKKIELSYLKKNGKISSPKRELKDDGEPFCNPYDSSSS